jgi:peptidoglycan hydrolase-like protein with peptidoglycan-binding domain
MALQRGLNIVIGTRLDVDGGFGSDTKNACVRFQKMSRINANGVCGQQTWASLDIALDKLRR